MVMAPNRASTSLPPAKKAKTSHPSNTNLLNTVQDFEKRITDAIASNASLNPLADFLHLVHTLEDAQMVSKAIYGLYRIFVTLIQKKALAPNSDGDNKRKAVRTWVCEKLESYSNLLCGFLKDEEATLRASSLKILFSLLKHLSDPSNASPSSTALTILQFDASFFKRIVHALLICPSSVRSSAAQQYRNVLEADVRDLFVQEWLNLHADVRWYFLRETGASLSNPSFVRENLQIPSNALSILEKLTNMPTKSSDLKQWWVGGLSIAPTDSKSSGAVEDDAEDEQIAADDWRAFFDDPKHDPKESKSQIERRRIHTMTVHQQLHSVAAHRAMFTKCWLNLLPHLSSPAQDSTSTDEEGNSLALVSRALNVLHRGVMPHLTRAVMVMDWVAGCVDFGGSVGLLALNALFILMQEYNLDYPEFYTRLYAFLDRDVLHLRHRARFFRLTDLFLASSHLPATLLASFVKRLARLSLTAPPAAIVMIIPFTYNILKRHPALMVMIHRSNPDDAEDPFDPAEINPTQTNAIQSSLWELYSHRNHYHSAVSTLVKIFEEVFTKPNYSMEDFLDHSYGTLLETELKRKITKEPAMVDFEGKLGDSLQGQDGVVNRLWKLS